MPRRKRTTGRKPDFNASQAKAILEKLIERGRVSRADLNEAKEAIEAERQQLLARLDQLGGMPVLAAAGAAAVVTAAAMSPRVRGAVKRAARKARAKAVTPQRAAARILQGRYLGLMRQIPKAVVKKRFGKDAIASRGKQAVVDDMQSYLDAQRKK